MRQLFGNHQRSATGLPGKGHRPPNPVFCARSRFAGGLQLAADERQTGINAASFNHNDFLIWRGWRGRCGNRRLSVPRKASGTRWIRVSTINGLNGFKPATRFHSDFAVLQLKLLLQCREFQGRPGDLMVTNAND